jgi:kynurenine formamidase
VSKRLLDLSHIVTHGLETHPGLPAPDALPDVEFRFFAGPVKVRGMGTFPVRAFAIVP